MVVDESVVRDLIGVDGCWCVMGLRVDVCCVFVVSVGWQSLNLNENKLCSVPVEMKKMPNLRVMRCDLDCLFSVCVFAFVLAGIRWFDVLCASV